MNELKLSKIGVITLLLFGIVISFTGIVCGDPGVPAKSETQVISTETIADVVGTVMDTDAVTWSTTTGGIPISGDDPILANYPFWASSPFGSYQEFKDIWDHDSQIWTGVHLQDLWNYIINNPDKYSDQYLVWAKNFKNWAQNQGDLNNRILYDGEVRYSTSYDANIVAQAGHTVFTKTLNVDTQNKVIGQSNIKANTEATYIATGDGGHILGSENIMIDGAGNPTNASDRMLCPFGADQGNVIPAFCNIVQAGSKYDLTVGSVVTGADDRFIGTDATVPVILNYAIAVKPYTVTGQGTSLAMGSTSAYVKAHIQESRDFNITLIAPGGEHSPVPGTGDPTKAEDLTYTESSSASGLISSFSKTIAYQSGKALLP